MSGFPAIAELLPHAGAMRLLHRVVEHGPARTVCEALTSQAQLFREADGQIPAWVSIEWMAQCAGAHGALELLARGERLGLGFLTGGRQIKLLVPRMPADATIVVEAVPKGRSSGLYAFSCRAATSDGLLLAEAQLRIFVPRSPSPDAEPA